MSPLGVWTIRWDTATGKGQIVEWSDGANTVVKITDKYIVIRTKGGTWSDGYGQHYGRARFYVMTIEDVIGPGEVKARDFLDFPVRG